MYYLLYKDWKDTTEAYIDFANNMIAAYKNTIKGANKIFPSINNMTGKIFKPHKSIIKRK